MYPGYQGSYGSYGNSQQAASQGYQQGQQHSAGQGYQPGQQQDAVHGYQPGHQQASAQAYQLGQQAAAQGYQYGQQQAAAQGYQPDQQYYTGVNPYADYGYGTIGGAPPPPPSYFQSSTAPQSYGSYPSFPSSTNTTPGTSQGYDAAIYKYAREKTASLPAQNQQKESYQSPQYPQKPHWKHGGGGRQGRLQQPTDNTQHYCEVCKISCAGTATFNEHLNGQRHKKKLQSIQTGAAVEALPKNKLSYRCELCSILCTGLDTYEIHVRGQKHIKAQQLHRKLGKPIPEDIPTVLEPQSNGTFLETRAKPNWHQQMLPGSKKVIGINTIAFVGGHKLNSTGRLEEKKREVAEAVSSCGKPKIEVEDERLNAVMASEEIKPVGEDQVLEERDVTGRLVQFNCRVCDCQFSDPNAKEMHIKGRKHRMNYKLKIDPTYLIGPRTSKRGDKAKVHMPSGRGVEQPPSVNLLPASGELFAASIDNKSEILDEVTVDRKYRSLNPGEEFPVNIDQFSNDVIEALKEISDKLERENGEAADKMGRTIVGSLTTGALAKETFIKGEEFIEMVVTCTPIPTNELIQRVFDEFPKTANQSQMTIELDPASPVVLIISTTLFTTLKCRLYFTSLKIREDGVDTSQCPHTEMCIHALAIMRNAKWYETNFSSLSGLKETLRLMRDMRSRYPEWKILNDKKLEFVAIEIIKSDPCPEGLKPTKAFKRVIQAIASGFLFSAKILDPCEKGEVNVLNGLTDEHKHTLTASAQLFVRLIAFNQIHEILGVERQLDIVPEESVVSKTHKRAMELISGFNGEKLPENDDFDIGRSSGEKETDHTEPEVKKARREDNEEKETDEVGSVEELKKSESRSEKLEEADPNSEPELMEGAEPNPEREMMKEAELNPKPELMEGAEPNPGVEMMEGEEPNAGAKELEEADPNPQPKLMEEAEPKPESESTQNTD